MQLHFSDVFIVFGVCCVMSCDDFCAVSKDVMRAGLVVWGISGPRVPNFANSTGLRH